MNSDRWLLIVAYVALAALAAALVAGAAKGLLA